MQKSGLMDAFTIESGEDLQDYESIHKAARLLGFLSYCLENNNCAEASLSGRRISCRELLPFASYMLPDLRRIPRVSS